MRRFTLIATFIGLLGGALLAQPLSSQVLQLLARDNVWTGRQTFNDLRVPVSAPADTVDRLYNLAGVLYFGGSPVGGGGGGGGDHTLLSSTHTDTTAAAVLRGAILTGQGGSPTWARLAIGTPGQFLTTTDGVDVSWGVNGSALTTLNAANLSSGLVPLARISGLTNAQIDGAAAIAWTKINASGSSLADLSTRDAGDLISGTLSDARLSVNVTLLGSTIDLDGGESTGNLPVSQLNSGSGASATTFWRGDGTWAVPAGAGSGTVTSVALAMPGVFSVTGSPVTTAGTLTANLATQTANTVWAGPTGGAPASPTFRVLGYTDLPTSGVGAGTYPKVTVNTQGVVTAAVSQITLTTDVTGVLPLANGGTGLNAAADDTVAISNGSAWQAKAINNCTTGLTYATASNTFGCAGAVGTHAMLSASHSDTVAAGVTAGDLIYGTITPQWARLAIGANNSVLTSNGTAPSWSTSPTLLGLTITAAGGGSYVYGATSSVASAYTAAFAGVNMVARTQTYTTTEYTSGTHPIAYGTDINGVFGTGAAATTTAAVVHIGAFAGSTAVTTYSLLVDSLLGAGAGIAERGRSVLMGEWASPGFAAGDYTTNGAGGWTVAAGDVTTNSYTLVGKTIYWTIVLRTTTVTAAVGTELRVDIPGALTFQRTCSGSFSHVQNGTAGTGLWLAANAGTYVVFQVTGAAPNWTATTDTTSIDATIICEVN